MAKVSSELSHRVNVSHQRPWQDHLGDKENGDKEKNTASLWARIYWHAKGIQRHNKAIIAFDLGTVYNKMMELNHNIVSLMKNHHDMLALGDEGFMQCVAVHGIRKLCIIPSGILNSDIQVRQLINLDPYALVYLPAQFHCDTYFKEVKKKHEILLLRPLNQKLSLSTLNFIVDHCPEYVHFDFFKKPFAQLQAGDVLLREKIGIGFLIKGMSCPGYLAKDVDKYKGMRVDELVLVKKTILSYENIEKTLKLHDESRADIKIKI